MVSNAVVSGNMNKFRETLKLAHKIDMNWYPGHMNKGMKQMQRKLRSVDCIIEVHDARVPFSGRNPKFYTFLTSIKPHILVLNKSDLSIYGDKKQNHSSVIELKKKLCTASNDNSGTPDVVILTNSRKQVDHGLRTLVPTITDLITNSERYNRSEAREFAVMVIGIPNVGKSSVINRLRNMHIKAGMATPVGALAGVTRSVMEKIKISIDPLIYIYDTPGVLEPNMKNIEAGLQLALCGTFKDHLVGEQLMADYLLYYFNKKGIFSYVDKMGLKEPTDSIREALINFAINSDKYIKVDLMDGAGKVIRPNVNAAAALFIKDFREGYYGNITFDKDV